MRCFLVASTELSQSFFPRNCNDRSASNASSACSPRWRGSIGGAAASLFQALGGIVQKRQVGILVHVGIRVDQSKLFDERDIALERDKVRTHSRYVIIILLGEDPVEALGRLPGQARADRHHSRVV